MRLKPWLAGPFLILAACTPHLRGLPPSSDGITHTSGKQGKWVKGCPPTPCNMGVGNLGAANTYHWVEG